jgi:hypothetical protein
MVELSLPEVNSLCVRAARGVGWSWGMAEECGEAASWLAQFGLPWADVILNCLKTPVSTEMRPASITWANVSTICGLHAGVTLAEFMEQPEGPTAQGVTLGTVQDARLLLPFMARCATRSKSALEVSVASQMWATVTPDAIAVNTTHVMPGRIHVCLTQTTRPATHRRLDQAAPLLKMQKATLDALALNMTVPSSAQSEARAGSDTPDTD